MHLDLYVHFTHIILAYAQWYEKEVKQQTTTSIYTQDASKSIPARSPIECVLKCQRKLQEGYFIEEKRQCFCLNNKEQKIFSDEIQSVDGAFYQEHRVWKDLFIFY